jgi:hypothetical protein
MRLLVMDAWEYLQNRGEEQNKMLTCDFVEVFHLCDEVYVVPPGKIDLQWITQKCPQSQINWDEDSFLEKVSFPSIRDAGECYSAVLEYAGSQGWQPYTAEYCRSQSVPFWRSGPA